MQLVDEVGKVVQAVLVASCLAQPHVGVLGQRSGVQGVQGRRGFLPEDGPAQALPGPLAYALEVAGGNRLGLQRPLNEGGLAIKVVGAPTRCLRRECVRT